MTTKSKIKRVRWMAALTLALLFLSLASPFFGILSVLMPGFDGINRDRAAEWEGICSIIFVLLYVILFVCLVVFFVRLFRGLKQGKIFVPGNARWLYIGALLPLPIILYRGMYLILFGGPSLLTTFFVSSLVQQLALFSAFTLMALLYDVATDVSEENQLTV